MLIFKMLQNGRQDGRRKIKKFILSLFDYSFANLTAGDNLHPSLRGNWYKT